MSESAHTIVAVDDEEVVLKSFGRTLRASGFERVVTTSDSREAMRTIEAERPAVLLLDLIMPHLGGREILEMVTSSHADVVVVVVTAEQDARIAVECMKLGAYDYILKPVSSEELVATVTRAVEHHSLRRENEGLRGKLLDRTLDRPEAFRSIITTDEGMERVFAYLEVVARGSQPVLVTGETGTGKELIARAIHHTSGRRGPFVAVNVAGLDDTVFSDTLFGHKAGAFTGATGPRKGMIEQAGSGTLFLDEIGDLTEQSQVKLLRLLQEREYYPLGADSPRRMDARVVAATHQDIGSLRSDLYFRLRSYHVEIPPLRDRLGDLQVLVERFVREAAEDLGKTPPDISVELIRRLERYQYPGNVRELRAMVFDAVAHHQSGPLPIEPFERVMGEIGDSGGEASNLDTITSSGTVIPSAEWARLEKQNMENALERANWKVSGRGGAAELLGISPSTLESRMKSFGIRRPD